MPKLTVYSVGINIYISIRTHTRSNQNILSSVGVVVVTIIAVLLVLMLFHLFRSHELQTNTRPEQRAGESKRARTKTKYAPTHRNTIQRDCHAISHVNWIVIYWRSVFAQYWDVCCVWAVVLWLVHSFAIMPFLTMFLSLLFFSHHLSVNWTKLFEFLIFCVKFFSNVCLSCICMHCFYFSSCPYFAFINNCIWKQLGNNKGVKWRSNGISSSSSTSSASC